MKGSWISIIAIGFLWNVLQGTEFVFVPDHQPYVSTFFSKEKVRDYKSACFWDKVKCLLENYGHSASAVKTKKVPAMLNKTGTKLVVWNQINSALTHLLQKANRDKFILLVLEPPSVLQELHTQNYLKHFSKVLTWEDDRIDGNKFFKYYHPVCYPMIDPVVPFKEKKLCNIMAANKTSQYSGEIYSERRVAIAYFNQFPDQFDLYGPSWRKEGFVSYKGMVDNKIGALKHYKFSICYENTVGMNGYITEKIFDCFHAGVVPVYLGAPNILDEVPADCFIDKRNFDSYESLHNYLLSITEEEYNRYIERIKEFLISEKARNYTQDGAVLAVVNGLTGMSLTFNDLPL